MYIKTMTANSPDLSPIENLWWIFLMAYKKAVPTKENLSTAILNI